GEREKKYDEVKDQRSDGDMAGDFGQGFKVDDLGDLFGGLFNRGRSRGTGPQRGADQEAEVHLSFEDAVAGVTTSVMVVGEAACAACAGTGAAPGTTPVTCARCQGKGTVSDNQGFFSFSQPCPACRGRGTRIESPCSACGGSGVDTKTRNVRVRIPAGVESGQKIRVKGRGGPGKAGGPSGDLL
ncbi:chaperone protein DnaJ, partial [mine drainage metagenome]